MINTSPSSPECFALLDDSSAAAAQSPSSPLPRLSRLYTGHVHSLQCLEADQLPQLIEQMQQALRDGLHAVSLFSYELGIGLQRVRPRRQSQAAQTLALPQPLAQILLFTHCDYLNHAEVDAWLTQRQAAQSEQTEAGAGIANLRPNISAEQFAAAIAKIHAYIEAGDTYQVNYTYRLRFDVYGSPVALYRQLRLRQPVPYGSLIQLADGAAVVSLSPELFVRHAEGVLTARPMKGTAAASGDAEQDRLAAKALAADPKNLAENLMIVDLLRNDLGRIAVPGSVRVPQLFEVTQFNTVLQMTSTVQAQVRDDVSLGAVIQALYPCGSITGAPKHRTMQIIDELEPDPRGLYTGAIGWFDAEQAGRRFGDFCLSVPIRTLWLQPAAPDGLYGASIRHGEMGVGAGIVHDSVAAEEYAECALKAKFLTGMGGDFSLFETIYATSADGCRHLDLHLQRLQASAAYFGFPYNDQALRAALQAHCASLPATGPQRLRLTLSADGNCSLQSAQLGELETPVSVLISPLPTQSDDLFLRHKTSVRQRYDQAWRQAQQLGAFDMLFFNQEGELTEGGRSSVFLKLDGRWYTPPLTSGLLPGVMRSVVLNDPAWKASERSLRMEDLLAAEQIMVCNALRGTMPARLLQVA
ncbi:para-aminobenzoate synthetase / 4-amino-4-deoxychorismate lyase [Collimonas sp. OK242]|uniref:aminodeoxychorismate synthase component I n=1 Tax=Collimonas sp. OK242 TaxID=1798195 RepID=UPI000894C0C3|nr:aminodeoxychorismate synthase component I [Collimonas sp. OK242]SDX76567.1 para-aminobenzoate synthetase / 4-amino-4-deoxychorismate lyase [Collimonas sp. OK242]